MKAFTPLTLAIALLFAPACDDEDAAPGADAAVPGADTGAPSGDTGGLLPDAGATADVAAGETAPSAGDAGATGDVSSSGAWTVYDVPDAGLLAMGIMGTAEA